jgi:hypothetical protein
VFIIMTTIMVECKQPMKVADGVKYFSEHPDGSPDVVATMSSFYQAAVFLKRGNLLQVAGGVEANPYILRMFKGIIATIEHPDSEECAEFIKSLEENSESTKTVSDWANIDPQASKKPDNKSWADRVANGDDDDLAPELPPTPGKIVVKKLNEVPEPDSSKSGGSVEYWLARAEDDPQAFKKKFNQSDDIFGSMSPKRIKMCHHGDDCRYRHRCGFAHTKLELTVMRAYWKKQFKIRKWVWSDPNLEEDD